MSTRPNPYTPEFKTALVREVIDHSRSLTDVARENNIPKQILRNWVRKHHETELDHTPDTPLRSEERAELHRLQKENRELRQENEFLGKATAFFEKRHP